MSLSHLKPMRMSKRRIKSPTITRAGSIRSNFVENFIGNEIKCLFKAERRYGYWAKVIICFDLVEFASTKSSFLYEIKRFT